MTNSREQAARAIPFILKRRSESEREAYLQGYNAGCEHEAKRILEAAKKKAGNATNLLIFVEELFNPPKEESE